MTSDCCGKVQGLQLTIAARNLEIEMLREIIEVMRADLKPEETADMDVKIEKIRERFRES